MKVREEEGGEERMEKESMEGEEGSLFVGAFVGGYVGWLYGCLVLFWVNGVRRVLGEGRVGMVWRGLGLRGVFAYGMFVKKWRRIALYISICMYGNLSSSVVLPRAMRCESYQGAGRYIARNE